MTTLLRVFYSILASFATIAMCIIAYRMIAGTLSTGAAGTNVSIDYTNAVVILLTTVTVIFSVCALVLAILGIVGFRSLRREAGRFASQQALKEIYAAFDDKGRATEQIRDEFVREDGHLKNWASKQIRQEVIALLPLIAARLPSGHDDFGVDATAPTDEGEVD